MKELFMVLCFIFALFALPFAFIYLFEYRPTKKTQKENVCLGFSCGALKKVRCGSGYCAQHCRFFCDGECIDPLKPELKIMDGGKKKS